MRLRAYLILMSAALLIPVIGFYAMALHMLEDSGQETAFRQLDEKSNSISLMVERELSSAQAALDVLATSLRQQDDDLAAFHEQARAANRGPLTWLELLDENGQQLINTLVPYGTPLPPPMETERAQRVLESGNVLVSNVTLGPVSQKLVTTLNLPVYHSNGNRYVLVMVFSTDHFLKLIRSAEISSDWTAGILDGEGRFVARTLHSEDKVGKPARPELVDAVKAQRKGMIRHRTLEGMEAYDTFRPIPNTNWSVAIAAPVEIIDSAAVKAARLAGAGMLAGVLVATILAVVFGGRIVRSIKHAGEAAIKLGRGGKPEFGRSHIKEVNSLYGALNEASKQLLQAQNSRLQAEARATEAGELLQLAVNAAELGTFHCPLPMNKIYWNDICNQHFFLPENAEVDFDLFYSRIHPEDRERTRLAVETAIFNHGDYDVEYRAQAPDGRTRWLRAKGRAYYDSDGQAVRFDGITIDISRNKEVEARLERASRQKDDFLAMLAHELRNPLAPISSAASLLTLSGADPAKLSRTSEIITRQVRHMAGLLEDLLDVSRVTRGMIKLNKSVINIKNVISAAAEQVHPLMQARRHQFAVELSAQSLHVFGDEKRLVQIIVNLLTNAGKYTPDGGNIRLTLDADADNIFIQVKDDGVGISPDLIPRVFELFVQGERTPDRQQGGLGLGLALVKSLSELHGGEVGVVSDGIGKGCTFTVRLPRHDATHQILSAEIDPSAAAFTAAPMKIMVVDDNEDAAHTLAMFLEALGNEVLVEVDPQQALQRSAQAAPDVFILDIGMPGMDGNELARKLRMQPETRKACLIAISGYGQENDKIRSAAAGFDHHLLKPVHMQKLLSLLHEYSLSTAQTDI